MSFLDDKQRAEFDADRAFTIENAKSRRRYRITHGRIANIEVLSRRTGRRLHRLCVHPANEDLPIEDVMLSQLLHLRADEDGLVARANVHP